MKRTIIYVFGPKRLASLYFSNKELEQKDGGWLKIGLTSSDDDDRDKRDVAMDRINGEVRTGIPEVCQLLDVFEYPEQQGKTDDKIRNILTDDIYNLECSRVHNKDIEKYEIKAGREFVYGVTRNQVFNAVAKFERDLILANYGKDGFDALMALIQKNNTDVSPFENEEEADTDVSTPKSEFCDRLWDAVVVRIKSQVNATINNVAGRPYINFKSPTQDGFYYDANYSVRYGMANVAIATDNGEAKQMVNGELTVDAKQAMNKYIADNDIRSQIPNLSIKQGTRNEKKWSWVVSDTLDKSFEELVDWFANTILTFYNAFEKSATL